MSDAAPRPREATPRHDLDPATPRPRDRPAPPPSRGARDAPLRTSSATQRPRARETTAAFLRRAPDVGRAACSLLIGHALLAWSIADARRPTNLDPAGNVELGALFAGLSYIGAALFLARYLTTRKVPPHPSREPPAS